MSTETRLTRLGLNHLVNHPKALMEALHKRNMELNADQKRKKEQLINQLLAPPAKNSKPE